MKKKGGYTLISFTRRESCEGYTLIEILIVLAITGILFTIGYNSFQDYSRQQALVAAARSMQTDLRQAQESAIAGTKPTGCVTLNGYQFNVLTSSTYEIDANCTNNVIQIKLSSLPVGLTVATPNPNPIIFKSLAQGTNIPLANTATITITQTSTQNVRNVTIGSNGNIQ